MTYGEGVRGRFVQRKNLCYFFNAPILRAISAFLESVLKFRWRCANRQFSLSAGQGCKFACHFSANFPAMTPPLSSQFQICNNLQGSINCCPTPSPSKLLQIQPSTSPARDGAFCSTKLQLPFLHNSKKTRPKLWILI